ncbi:MAG TPA: hydrogenase maturation protease [Acidobacteriaceae bacterium]|nr:hydrogenase maturation protease [Acidobacteriaceae bacterium]
MSEPPGAGGAPALLLACGNSLRQDDGVGLRIAEAAERRFSASRLRIVAAQQFTPEMAMELAEAELAIFVDACVTDEPGAIRIAPVAAQPERREVGAEKTALPESHRLDPPAMLALAGALCGRSPARAYALTIGAGSLGYGEHMSGPVRQAVPRALRLLESLLGSGAQPRGHSTLRPPS